MNSTNNQNSSDGIAKRLSLAIFQAAQDDLSFKHLLRTRGLLDWVKYDHLKSSNPIELAADVLVYLFNSNKFAEIKILTGILAFLKDHGREVIPSQLPKLKKLLEEKPLDKAQIEEWFRTSFKCY